MKFLKVKKDRVVGLGVHIGTLMLKSGLSDKLSHSYFAEKHEQHNNLVPNLLSLFPVFKT